VTAFHEILSKFKNGKKCAIAMMEMRTMPKRYAVNIQQSLHSYEQSMF